MIRRLREGYLATANSIIKSLRVRPPGLWEMAQKAAKAAGMDTNAWVLDAMWDKLGRRREPQYAENPGPVPSPPDHAYVERPRLSLPLGLPKTVPGSRLKGKIR